MDRLSANQILAFYPYFVWYTIMAGICWSLTTMATQRKQQSTLEYNIQVLTIEMTGRKP